MGRNLIEKIVAGHLVRGEIRTGAEVVVRVDQTLSHDLSSIIVAQIMEAVDADRATVDKAVFYCDHNVLCTVEDNSDDHYLYAHGRGALRRLVLQAGQRHLPHGPL